MLDDLMDWEEDYSDYLSKVCLGLQESQGGALASKRAMPAEEQRAQFQHLNQCLDSITEDNKDLKGGMANLTELVRSLLLNPPQIPSQNHLHVPPNPSQSQYLISHFFQKLSLTIFGWWERPYSAILKSHSLSSPYSSLHFSSRKPISKSTDGTT